MKYVVIAMIFSHCTLIFAGKRAVWSQRGIDAVFAESVILFEGKMIDRKSVIEGNSQECEATIVISKPLKGGVKRGQKINIKWSEWTLSGCPHEKTLIPLRKKTFWYSKTDNIQKLDTMPFKGVKTNYQAYDTELFPNELRWKNKE